MNGNRIGMVSSASGSDKEKLSELEAEIERHKARFLAASRKGLDSFRRDLSPVEWIASYPAQAALIAFVGGLWLGFALDRPKAQSLP